MNPLKKLLKHAPAKPGDVSTRLASSPAKASAVPQAAPKPASGLEGKPSAAPAPPSITISKEAIAQAAYFRWQRCGGDALTNWCLAEQELREEAAKIGLKA